MSKRKVDDSEAACCLAKIKIREKKASKPILPRTKREILALLQEHMSDDQILSLLQELLKRSMLKHQRESRTS